MVSSFSTQKCSLELELMFNDLKSGHFLIKPQSHQKSLPSFPLPESAIDLPEQLEFSDFLDPSCDQLQDSVNLEDGDNLNAGDFCLALRSTHFLYNSELYPETCDETTEIELCSQKKRYARTNDLSFSSSNQRRRADGYQRPNGKWEARLKYLNC